MPDGTASRAPAVPICRSTPPPSCEAAPGHFDATLCARAGRSSTRPRTACSGAGAFRPACLTLERPASSSSHWPIAAAPDGALVPGGSVHDHALLRKDGATPTSRACRPRPSADGRLPDQPRLRRQRSGMVVVEREVRIAGRQCRVLSRQPLNNRGGPRPSTAIYLSPDGTIRVLAAGLRHHGQRQFGSSRAAHELRTPPGPSSRPRPRTALLIAGRAWRIPAA
jgi:hypothetical protein